jgi:hypothetical protein
MDQLVRGKNGFSAPGNRPDIRVDLFKGLPLSTRKDSITSSAPFNMVLSPCFPKNGQRCMTSARKKEFIPYLFRLTTVNVTGFQAMVRTT